MSSGTGASDLLWAIRQVQITDSTLAAAGVFLFDAPREDDPPYFLNSIYQPGKGKKNLSGTDSNRRIILSLKAVAVETEDGKSGFENASDLADANYRLWTEIIDGLTPQQRLNAVLNPRGWNCDMPLEKGDVGPYYEHVDDVRRDHNGHLFLFVISRI